MAGISYGLVDFVSGGPILDLPVKTGATWSAQLNRPDALTCEVDMRDPDALALDLRASTEPMKTLLIARNEDDVIIAWGLIPDDGRSWDEDTYTLSLVAQGIWSSYFGATVIGPPSILTGKLTALDSDGFLVVNPALNTTISGVSHGTIGKRLIQQRLAFPGAPTVFDLPPDEIGFRQQEYEFASMKKIGPALDDLVRQEGGPDFAFDAARAPGGVGLRYSLRHGSEENPRIGANVGSWSFGGVDSPVSKLKLDDAVSAGASLGLMTAGRNVGEALVSRIRNQSLVASGYPPFDVVDTSHSDVSKQETLDSYNRENMAEAEHAIRDLSFTVQGDATPALGEYRPGDRLTLDPPERHPWHTGPIPIRITSMSGDETGEKVEIGCVILNDPA